MKLNFLKIIIIITSLLLSGCTYSSNNVENVKINSNNSKQISLPEETKLNNPEEKKIPKFTEPIDNALERITKKPFGIKISFTNSPITPEKFSGYHTGVDFEIVEEEIEMDIPIFAICTGPIILKKWINGYGGAVVQRCLLDNEDITVLYGHLKLSSIQKNINDNNQLGNQIGILGKGESTDTDDERKHLHLGIHKGNKINLLGYAQNQKDLQNWIDIADYLE